MIKPNTLKRIALNYQKQGLSIIPLGKNKETNLVKWKHLQEAPADKEEINHWPWLRAKGLALITGFASGNVEVIDFRDKCSKVVEIDTTAGGIVSMDI